MVKNLIQCRRRVEDEGSIPGSGRSPGGQWQPAPVFLPGKFPWTEKLGRLQSKGLQKGQTRQCQV